MAEQLNAGALHDFCRGENIPVLKHNAMRTCGDSNIESPCIVNLCLNLKESSVSRFGHFTLRERDSGSHWIGKSLGNGVVEM
jgi:hypothetical protein